MRGEYTMFILLLLTFIFCLPANAQHAELVTDQVSIYRNGADIFKLSVLIPIPQTNQYQTVHSVSYDGGIYCVTDGSGDSYARFQFGNSLNDNEIVSVRTQISYHVISTDFLQIDPNISYDTTSEEYRLYTGATAGGYVDPSNDFIRTIADSIWAISENIIVYAYHCYNYVADNYSYLYPNTGIHPLSQIIADGGGDCGNLSSIFISLLRSKGVPARHVVSVFPNGGCHVWAEFNMGEYGWIPVDVTYHLSDPEGNYFGQYNYNAVIVGYDVGHTYSRWGNDDTYVADILQTSHWWYWSYSGEPTTDWSIYSEEITIGIAEVGDAQDMKVYQSSGNIIIELENCEGEQSISVFDLCGRPIVLNQNIHDTRTVVSVPSTGLYIVQFNGKSSRKIFVLK